MFYLLGLAAGCLYLGFGRSRKLVRLDRQRAVDLAVSQDFNRVICAILIARLPPVSG